MGIPTHAHSGADRSLTNYFTLGRQYEQRLGRGMEFYAIDRFTQKSWTLEIFDYPMEMHFIDLTYAIPFMERPSFVGSFSFEIGGENKVVQVLFFSIDYRMQLDKKAIVTPKKFCSIVKTIMRTFNALEQYGCIYGPMRPESIVVTETGGYLAWSRWIGYANGIMVLEANPYDALYQGYTAWNRAIVLGNFAVPTNIARSHAIEHESLFSCLTSKFSKPLPWDDESKMPEWSNYARMFSDDRAFHTFMYEYILGLCTVNEYAPTWRVLTQWIFGTPWDLEFHVKSIENLERTCGDVLNVAHTTRTMFGYRNQNRIDNEKYHDNVFVEFGKRDPEEIIKMNRFICSEHERSFASFLSAEKDPINGHIVCILDASGSVPIENFAPLTMADVDRIALTMFENLAMLHRDKIELRNLQLNNVLYDPITGVQFTQYLTAKRHATTRELVFPLGIATAPIVQKFHANRDDVWSAGMILLYLLCKLHDIPMPPFTGNITEETLAPSNHAEIQAQIKKTLGRFTEENAKFYATKILNRALGIEKRAPSKKLARKLALRGKPKAKKSKAPSTKPKAPPRPDNPPPGVPAPQPNVPAPPANGPPGPPTPDRLTRENSLPFNSRGKEPYCMLSNFSWARIVLDERTVREIREELPMFFGQVGDRFESSEHLWRATQAGDLKSYRRLTSEGDLGMLRENTMLLFYPEDPEEAKKSYEFWMDIKQKKNPKESEREQRPYVIVQGPKKNVGIVAKMVYSHASEIGFNLIERNERLEPEKERRIWLAILRAKFTQNTGHLNVLLQTGNKLLFEFVRGKHSDHWGGKFPKDGGPFFGENAMGIYVQAIRDELRGQ